MDANSKAPQSTALQMSALHMLLHVPPLTISRSKTSDQMLEATASEALHVAATTSTTTVVVLHRHEAIVQERTVSDLQAEDHLWMIIMTEGMADVLPRETFLLHLLGGTSRILTMLGALLHQLEATIRTHDTRTPMRDRDLLPEATLAAAAVAVAVMEAMTIEDTDSQSAKGSILHTLGGLTERFVAEYCGEWTFRLSTLVDDSTEVGLKLKAKLAMAMWLSMHTR